MKKSVIICVDDETTVLRSLKAELREAFGSHYLIEIAEGGEDALELLAELIADGNEVPLIISDYIMPDMKGDELLKKVHQISPKTVKVMLTGQATIEAVGNAVKYAKLYRYLSKPWEAEDLRLTVTEAVNSYLQDKQLAEKTTKLLQANQELEKLTREQAALIEELHENENRLKQSTKELAQLNQAFSRFVPSEFIQLLNKDSIVDVELGDHLQREMSILFADIRDFTSLSEKMSPQDNFQFINSFFQRIEPAIIENNGFIDKYIGDAVMALFSGSADDAVRAGIAMLQSLNDYNQTRQRPDRAPIRIGIGINTGSLMIGTVGGQNRLDNTVISDTVNSASRIEGLTKQYGVPLLISQNTFFQLQDVSQYAIRLIDQVQVKGKTTEISVFEVFDADVPEIRDRKLATKSLFEQAVVLHRQQNFPAAAQCFQDCLSKNPADPVAQHYLQLIQQAN